MSRAELINQLKEMRNRPKAMKLLKQWIAGRRRRALVGKMIATGHPYAAGQLVRRWTPGMA